MMQFMNMIKVFLFVVFSVHTVTAQLDLRIGVSADTVAIGQDLVLDIELMPGNKVYPHLISLGVFDSLGLAKYLFPDDSLLAETKHSPVDFELTDPGKWKLGESNNLFVSGKQNFIPDETGKIKNRVTVKIWDPGVFLILPERILWKDDIGTEEIYYPETKQGVLVFVQPPHQVTEGEVEMLPIKDILREGRHWTDFKWLYIAIGAIALFLFLIGRPVRQRRKQVKKKAKTIVIRPAHELALEKLTSLRDEKLWQKGEIKTFQSKLSYIIREYLENRYAIKALESTTGEIIKDMSDKSFTDQDIADLRQLLEIADLVKFARAKPAEDIHSKFLDQTFDFIKRTKEKKEEKDD